MAEPFPSARVLQLQCFRPRDEKNSVGSHLLKAEDAMPYFRDDFNPRAMIGRKMPRGWIRDATRPSWFSRDVKC